MICRCRKCGETFPLNKDFSPSGGHRGENEVRPERGAAPSRREKYPRPVRRRCRDGVLMRSTLRGNPCI